jgi:hypothetical protein
MKRKVILWLTAMATILFVAACATQSAVKPVSMEDQGAVAEKVFNNPQDYDIYYYEWGGQVPACLVFGIKHEGKKIVVGPNWQKINSKQELDAVLDKGTMRKTHVAPRLEELTGSDGTVWGYALTMTGSVMAIQAGDTMTIPPPRDIRPSR